jgi:hypothetical protein
MHKIEQENQSRTFVAAWSAAGRNTQQQAVHGLSWLRANLNLPMDEHLSSRIGNQIFFVFVNTAEFDYQQSSKCCSLFNADGRVAWRMGGVQ